MSHWSEGPPIPDFVEVAKPGGRINRALPGQPPSVYHSSVIALPKSATREGVMPTYDESFIDIVADLSRRGYTLSAIAGAIGVTAQVICDWKALYPAFEQEISRAAFYRQYYLEEMFIEAIQTGGVGQQMTGLIHALKTAKTGEFQERQQIEHSGSMSLEALVNDSLKAIPPPGDHDKVIEGETVTPL